MAVAGEKKGGPAQPLGRAHGRRRRTRHRSKRAHPAPTSSTLSIAGREITTTMITRQDPQKVASSPPAPRPRRPPGDHARAEKGQPPLTTRRRRAPGLPVGSQYGVLPSLTSRQTFRPPTRCSPNASRSRTGTRPSIDGHDIARGGRPSTVSRCADPDHSQNVPLPCRPTATRGLWEALEASEQSHHRAGMQSHLTEVVRLGVRARVSGPART